MKGNETAWRALRRPVSIREAAKLLEVPVAEIERMIRTTELLVVTFGPFRLIPICEMRAARARS